VATAGTSRRLADEPKQKGVLTGSGRPFVISEFPFVRFFSSLLCVLSVLSVSALIALSIL
jgi:hypothetical protein